jgi:triacylglycerol lipase
MRFRPSWAAARHLVVGLTLLGLLLAAGASPVLAGSGGAGTPVEAPRGQLWQQGQTWQQYVQQRPGSAFDMASLVGGTYSKAAALSLAEAAMLSYEDRSVVETVVKRDWGFSGFEFLHQAGTQAFLAWTDEVLLVAFRGTDAGDDWLDNLQVTAIKPPHGTYGKVHKGFFQAFQRVEGSLRTALAGAGSKAVWITGHSLGGALATVAAAELEALLPRAQVVTFGQPRVGFAELKAYVDGAYGGRYHRFVNRRDPVTRVPFRLSWRHVEHLYHVDSEAPDGVSRDREPGLMTPAEFRQLRRDIRQLREARQQAGGSLRQPELKGPVRSLSDHRILNYVRAVERLP